MYILYTSLENNYVAIYSKRNILITDRMFIECAAEITIKFKTTLKFLQFTTMCTTIHAVLSSRNSLHDIVALDSSILVLSVPV